MTFLWIHFEDGKRVALTYPSFVDPDWQTALMAKFVEDFHGIPAPGPVRS